MNTFFIIRNIALNADERWSEMVKLEKAIKGLEHCDFGSYGNCYEKECPYYQSHDCTDELKNDILALLKEHEAMSPDEFKNELLKMFSSIWDCEIDHSIFQDTVGELMSAVMQLYTQAVKRK